VSLRRVVEHTAHVLLVGTDIVWISVEDLSDHVDSSYKSSANFRTSWKLMLTSRLEGTEEVITDLLSTVEAQSINGILLHQIRDPRVEHALNIGILGSEVR